MIDLSSIIDGIRRSVRLELDREWINDYIERRAQFKHCIERSSVEL